MSGESRVALVIPDRPQISVEEKDGMVTISVAGIGDGFDTVEINNISFPLDCAAAISEALNELANS